MSIRVVRKVTVDNVVANQYWEWKLPAGFKKPLETEPNEVVRRFITDKYIKKYYANGNKLDPVKEYLTNGYVSAKEELKQQVVHQTAKASADPSIIFEECVQSLPSAQIVYKQPLPPIISPPSNTVWKTKGLPATNQVDLLDYDFSSSQKPLEVPLIAPATLEETPASRVPVVQPVSKPALKSVLPTMVDFSVQFKQPSAPYANSVKEEQVSDQAKPVSHSSATRQQIPMDKLMKLKQCNNRIITFVPGCK
eukprot:TRINITY_DN14230_c0_g1_i10.p1 TRINITY_DN14230_c0_g1~~TRINITY_DN14230_c0_g1_i10.p1  ORF type:complete len:251 (+),score=15.88 TRINITY_DN14230_c0_g1_i10:340-1092(+)